MTHHLAIQMKRKLICGNFACPILHVSLQTT
jgi:hypothetical protein